MKRLLWIGDAGCPSGFAKITHGVLDVLCQTWDVHVLGLNYRGDPHPYPYKIYPAWPGGDGFGNGRLKQLIPTIGPDVVVVLNDPWNLPPYMKRIGDVPVVASLAVDGKNCRARGLNGLSLAVFWTQFGMSEANAGGYAGPACVIPLGVDLETFKPMERAAARQMYGIRGRAADAFIVGNVNRNQPRKRLDLTIQYFAAWVKTHRVDNAYLMLHVAPTGDVGYDCEQLASYYGVANRLIIVQPEVWSTVSDEAMALTYNCFDVFFNTSQNEGWHLPTMEAMACGVPTIGGAWAALDEWPEDAMLKVPCPTTAVTPNNINTIGGVPDRLAAVDALQRLYSDADMRAMYSRRGLELTAKPEYRWQAIGEAYDDVIGQVTDARSGELVEKAVAV